MRIIMHSPSFGFVIKPCCTVRSKSANILAILSPQSFTLCPQRHHCFSSLLNTTVLVQPHGFGALTQRQWESWGVTECLSLCPFTLCFFFFPVFQVTSVHQLSFPGPLAAELNHSSLFLLSSFASKWCYVASLFPHHSWFHAFEWWACGKAIESEKYSNLLHSVALKLWCSSWQALLYTWLYTVNDWTEME